MQDKKLIALTTALNVLDRPSTDSSQTIIIAIGTIDNNLDALTSENFKQFGNLLVKYGDKLLELFNNANSVAHKKFFESKLTNFYTQLRKISKLGKDDDLNTLNKQWRVMLATLKGDEKFKTEIIPESFNYYFIKNRINRIFSESESCCIALLEWLIPDRLGWLDDIHIGRAIETTVECLSEKQAADFILYYVKRNFTPPLGYMMDYALQNGRCDVIRTLLAIGCPLRAPSRGKIDSFGLTLQIAALCTMEDIVSAIHKEFTSDQILRYAFQEGLYQVAANYLEKNKLYYSPEDLILITEIASTCGDIAALKIILNHCIPEARDQLLKQHILPFYAKVTTAPSSQNNELMILSYGNKQEVYAQEMQRAINTVKYYLLKDKCDLSLSSEKSGILDLRKVGNLRKFIAYKAGNPKPYVFGTIRSNSSNTDYRPRYQNYFNLTVEKIVKEGKANKNSLFTALGIEVAEYQVYANIGNQVKIPMTTYRQLRQPGSISTGASWAHTHSKYFPELTAHLHNLLDSRKTISRSHHGIKLLIAILKLAAQIQYYKYHTSIYFRGAAAAAEIIASALANSYQLNDLRYYQKQAPECVALETTTEEEFLTIYPSIYGFTSYEDMAKQLHKDFIASQEYAIAELLQALEMPMSIPAAAAHMPVNVPATETQTPIISPALAAQSTVTILNTLADKAPKHGTIPIDSKNKDDVKYQKPAQLKTIDALLTIPTASLVYKAFHSKRTESIVTVNEYHEAVSQESPKAAI